MHDRGQRVSLILEDTLAAIALVLLLYFVPHVVLALERPKPEAPDYNAIATHYAGIIAACANGKAFTIDEHIVYCRRRPR